MASRERLRMLRREGEIAHHWKLHVCSEIQKVSFMTYKKCSSIIENSTLTSTGRSSVDPTIMVLAAARLWFMRVRLGPSFVEVVQTPNWTHLRYRPTRQRPIGVEGQRRASAMSCAAGGQTRCMRHPGNAAPSMTYVASTVDAWRSFQVTGSLCWEARPSGPDCNHVQS